VNTLVIDPVTLSTVMPEPVRLAAPMIPRPSSEAESTGSALVYSTFLGGSGADFGYGVAIDPHATRTSPDKRPHQIF